MFVLFFDILKLFCTLILDPDCEDAYQRGRSISGSKSRVEGLVTSTNLHHAIASAHFKSRPRKGNDVIMLYDFR